MPRTIKKRFIYWISWLEKKIEQSPLVNLMMNMDIVFAVVGCSNNDGYIWQHLRKRRTIGATLTISMVIEIYAGKTIQLLRQE